MLIMLLKCHLKALQQLTKSQAIITKGEKKENAEHSFHVLNVMDLQHYGCFGCNFQNSVTPKCAKEIELSLHSARG